MEDKRELYERAKKAYYEGNDIMGDAEFDELERELGLENVSYVGSSSPNYTVRHPFMMGSLSKVQVKRKEDGSIPWGDYLSMVRKYVGSGELIVTPKFDGCSFEYYWDGGRSYISSRGDGSWGRDLSEHLSRFAALFRMAGIEKEWREGYVLRGEVLIDRGVFVRKYPEFVNPRSFVSGILNRKYSDISDKSVIDDLSIVVYDTRYVSDGVWHDVDWDVLSDGVLDQYLPKKSYKGSVIESEVGLEGLYRDMEDYRKNGCRYALDGIVLKPVDGNRILNLDSERPSDCVALKFLPEIKETVVTGIKWQLGKTGEYTPVVLFDTVILDGKKVYKATGSNYGNVVENGIGVGARICISLAGDITPFISSVIEPSRVVVDIDDSVYIEGCHLMKELNGYERMRTDFLASCKSLNIPGLGDKLAEEVFDSLEYAVDHIYFVDGDKVFNALGGGNTASNILKAIEDSKEKKGLADVIASLNIRDCGRKCAEQCARELVNGDGDFTGLSSSGYSWCLDATSFRLDGKSREIYSRLCSVLRYKDASVEGEELSRYMNDYVDAGRTKVMLTGSPNGYKNKKAFLAAHPEYEETGKFSDCEILFTGDLSSTSSKMEKARKLGIEIREY